MIFMMKVFQITLWIFLDLAQIFTQLNQILSSALNNLIHIPKIKTVSYGNNSVRYHCANLWNQMFRNGTFRIDSNSANDVHLCKVNSVDYFKKKLKQHFLYEHSLHSQQDYILPLITYLFLILNIRMFSVSESHFFFTFCIFDKFVHLHFQQYHSMI